VLTSRGDASIYLSLMIVNGLVERDAQLDELNRLLRDVEAGEGRLLFLSGEAGIGKTVLMQEFARQVGARGRVGIAPCDGLSVSGALGPILPIAPALGLPLAELLDRKAPPEVIFERLLADFRASAGVTVLIGEDVHWADEATLKLIRFLGRRLGSVKALVVFTYRDDVLGPDSPLRVVLGDLASQPWVRRMTLSRLSPAAVRAMAAGHHADPDALYQLTGGNPFFVTEVLATDGEELPAGVRDAVLARAAVLSPGARSVLDAAAVMGAGGLDPDLLRDLIGGPIETEVDECLAVGVLESEGRLLAFRHGITWKTIESVMSPVRSVALNRRALELMRRHPRWRRDHARLAHHAERASDTKAVLRHALAAAREDTALGAHRQAARQYQRALRFADGLPAARQADLRERESHACYLSGLLAEAIEARFRAIELWDRLGDPRRKGDNLRWLSRLLWLSGQGNEALVRGHEALEILEGLPDGPELAWAYANLAQLRLHSIGWEERVLALGEKAIALAEATESTEALVHALCTVGAVRQGSDGDEDRRALLERSLALARAAGHVDHAARAWRNLAGAAMDSGLPDACARYVAEGIAFCREHDLVSWELALRSDRAVLRMRLGDWAGAMGDAIEVLNHPSSSALACLLALTTRSLILAWRGGDCHASLDQLEGVFEHSTALVGNTNELACVVRAEAAWLAGDRQTSLREASKGYEGLMGSVSPWIQGELALLLRRGGGTVHELGHLPEPFRLQLTGNWKDAAARWRELGYPLHLARALMEGDEPAVREAWETFDRLGAVPDARLAAARLRELGSQRIPRGPRAATRTNPVGLTAREVEVLSLIVEGKRDREIANQLFLSPRTVAHHVSSILRKLQVSDRVAAADAAARMGLVQIGQSANAI
jgi:DNA-binding CsgD family transcriptional regulator